jgi:hypothetical protein
MGDAKWPAWIEQWVLPYVREPVLRPVLIALLGHVVVVLVPVLLAVVRTRDGWAMGLLGAALALTAWAVWTELRAIGRPGAVALTAAASWLGTFGFAWLADATGTW